MTSLIIMCSLIEGQYFTRLGKRLKRSFTMIVAPTDLIKGVTKRDYPASSIFLGKEPWALLVSEAISLEFYLKVINNCHRLNTELLIWINNWTNNC